MSDKKAEHPFYFDFKNEEPGHTVAIGQTRQGKCAATVTHGVTSLLPCLKCGYPFGTDWLDGGETCPKCKLVQ